MDQVKILVQSGQIEKAKIICAGEKTPVANMIAKGIDRIGSPLKNIEVSIENVGKVEIYKLEKDLNLLATVSGAAPMIGFLGTVTGMIQAFIAIAQEEGMVSPKLLSSGIYEAMITTAAGLVVGIVAYLGYNYLVVQPTQNQAVTTKPSPIKGVEKAVESVKKPEPVKTEPVKTATIPAKSKAEILPKKHLSTQNRSKSSDGSWRTSGKGSKPATGGAQGSSTTKGDEGDPKGTVDGRAIMGTGTGQGTNSGAGYSLDLAGWDFASRPTIKDNVSTRNGRIVFKITVDDSGRIVQAIPLEYNVF
ncbi:hypothetical protein GHT06_006942 [Daphnia sinensis]|uniref:MotA/TolQ/ExbB proton channel domain-containing protein n=1 Tax=Daphnia sinensis TaxID=1820382 RepID=A0AAD5PLN2_9CRUS|nr:hypothetical protein GHT06_006942 [Daphnia sinensis]